MHAYGLDINQAMAWTYPQLKLMLRYQGLRARDEQRWQLVLASGMMSQEGFDTFWDALGGKPIEHVSGGTSTSTASSGKMGQQSHGVDAHGNVVARGAPLLSDIALGKAMPPHLIPIKVIDKSETKEDGSERSPPTAG